jgi:hypothetical protein
VADRSTGTRGGCADLEQTWFSSFRSGIHHREPALWQPGAGASVSESASTATTDSYVDLLAMVEPWLAGSACAMMVLSDCRQHANTWGVRGEKALARNPATDRNPWDEQCVVGNMMSFVPAVPAVPVMLASALLLAGCGLIDRPATAADSEATFRSQATAVAKAWQDRGITTAWTKGFIPLQELVVEPDWSTNGVLKASYGNGWIRTSSPLSDVSGRGVIRFADGTSLSAPLVGAKTAYSQLPKRSGACPTAGQPPTCQWLTITAARLSTVRIGTSRGQANVPAWHYTVDGLRQPLVRVAVARSAMTSLPVVELPGHNRIDGIVPAMQLESSRGDSIAFDIGIGACDKGARGLVREFPELIVIGGSVTPSDAGTPCTSQLLLHRVEVHTKRPVGTRPIVDALSGRPMVTQPAPPGH